MFVIKFRKVQELFPSRKVLYSSYGTTVVKMQGWISVKLHLRDGRTDGRTNTHGNYVHRDRRRHAVSTSLRLVTNRRTDRRRELYSSSSLSFICSEVVYNVSISKQVNRTKMHEGTNNCPVRPSVRLLDGV